MYDDSMLSALKNADNFLLCTHINPDGDAIGSMLAAGRLLRRMGKQVLMITLSPLPKTLAWLPDAELLKTVSALANARIDAALCVDASECSRMGDVWPYFEKAPLRLVIDHHLGYNGFADYALVLPEAAAAGEMIYQLWAEMGETLDREAAAQIYAAVSTDTGNFCFSSVNPLTFASMEAAVRTGFDLSDAARQLHLIKPRSYVMALSRALNSLKYFADGRATCTHLTARDKEECRITDGDLHGMVNQGLNIEGVRVTFMADESPEGWKISLRAVPGLDVAAVARRFGGGGHMLAAGCTIPGSYAEVEQKLIQALEEALG